MIKANQVKKFFNNAKRRTPKGLIEALDRFVTEVVKLMAESDTKSVSESEVINIAEKSGSAILGKYVIMAIEQRKKEGKSDTIGLFDLARKLQNNDK